jgi:hypothetical protein
MNDSTSIAADESGIGASQRAGALCERRQDCRQPQPIALDHLSLGRAHLGLAQAAGETASRDDASSDASEAAKHLDRAVDVLRQAGREDELPRGLLARAVLRRFLGDADGASADLAEAGEVAERGHMRLFGCDVHLEGTRQCLASGDVQGARERLTAARGIVEATGYLRRGREVVALGRLIDRG